MNLLPSDWQDLADKDRGINGWISTFSHGSGCRSCPAFFATKMDLRDEEDYLEDPPR